MSLVRKAAPPPTSDETNPLDGFASGEVDRIRTEFGPNHSPRPADDEVPHLSEVVDDMSKQAATAMIVRASRWLEYSIGIVTSREAELRLVRGEIRLRKERIKFRYGTKTSNIPEAEFRALEELEQRALIAEAELIEIEGVKKALDQVKSAASRCLTSHTASNPSLAS